MSQNFRVPWYWFRATFARHRITYLTVVLLVGLVGGLAIASVSAARRTESSFNVFLTSTNPSDMSVFLYAPDLTSMLSRLPLVRHVATASFDLFGFPAGHNGAPAFPPGVVSGNVTEVGTFHDEYVSQDVLAVTAGRRANPNKADEFVTTTLGEHLMKWHVGQIIPMYFYTLAQTQSRDFGTARVHPHERLDMHLVGTVVLNNGVVQDEVDRYPALLIFTPALTRPFTRTVKDYVNYSLQLVHGSRDVSAVEREIIAALPRGTTYTFHATSSVAGQVNRSIEPEAIALGVFGLIAALAALIISAALVARALQNERDDVEVLRALGGDPKMSALARLVGLLGAIVGGAALAVVVAVALSPLAPIGPVRAVYPHNGINMDWSVLGIGFAVIVVGVGAMAVILASRATPRGGGRARKTAVPVGSRAARLLTNAGFPVTSVVGVRFALEPGRERDAVPVRSALFGAVLAVAIVVATLTFGSSLNTLVTHPALYGWNWNYALSSSYTVPPQSTRLLSSDPYVAAWSGYSFPEVQIDGMTVPVLSSALHATVSPPLLSGHAVDAPNEIVLGAATMRELGKHLGETVVGGYGTPKDAPVYVPPVRLTIVGTATLPSVGTAFSLHPSMGTGAIIYNRLEPASMRKFLSSPYPTLNGPAVVFVRLRKGVSREKALASLRKIAAVGNRAFAAVPNGNGAGDNVFVTTVQYPAEIENYRSIGSTPAVLALTLALGAVVSLGLTLTASVRRRRRDLALLRTLGFTRRQLMAALAWQASVAAVIGVIVGIPLGAVLGRWLWTSFARTIFAVPEPTVPIVSVLVVALSALILANVVAALPGRSAARTSTAQILRDQ
ncbi:MAG TPA: FtsX-like permease family protein [Acidimicrobiales bacterium]|nr:FtsX-like permease family protein [Acidimicrobiales bacterium]